MIPIESIQAAAESAEKDHKWEEASDLFLQLAHFYKDSKAFQDAADLFMRAAISRERCEERKRIGYIWVQCASALENRSQGPIADVYDPLESSKHFFPTVDLYAWQRFTPLEKFARACRNAGYHLEMAGSVYMASVEFERAGDAFGEAKMFSEASRSYFLALLSFIERNGEVNEETVDLLEKSLEPLIREDERKYLKRARVYYRGLAGKLISKGNYRDATYFFGCEYETERRLAKKEKRIGKWLAYTFWRATSNYGDSLELWAIWSVLLFVFAFPIIFRMTGTLRWLEPGSSAHWLDYIFFSISTVTTATDPGFGKNSLGKWFAMVEGLIGFLMLGSLLSLVAKKTLR